MERILESKELVIFGVGDIGTDFYGRLKKCNYKGKICFCDNNIKKQGTCIDGVEIVALDRAKEMLPNALYVITVINHIEAVKRQLGQSNIPQQRILIFTKDDYINPVDKKMQEKIKQEYRTWCEKYNSKVVKLKDRFQGERCFIIGTGGSLTNEDLEKLQNEYTFGCNRLYKMFSELKWRPVFYCFYDAQRLEMLKKDLSYIIDNSDYVFTSSGIKDNIENKYIDMDKMFFVHVEKEKYYPKLPKFSEDIEQCVYDGQTVIYMATQIAVYLGFKEIYYLGVDNHYSVELNLDGTVRYDAAVKDYPEQIGGMELERSVIPQIELTTMSFESVKQYADAHNINVYNATRGGKLEVFERADLDEIIRRV